MNGHANGKRKRGFFTRQVNKEMEGTMRSTMSGSICLAALAVAGNTPSQPFDLDLLTPTRRAQKLQFEFKPR